MISNKKLKFYLAFSFIFLFISISFSEDYMQTLIKKYEKEYNLIALATLFEQDTKGKKIKDQNNIKKDFIYYVEPTEKNPAKYDSSGWGPDWTYIKQGKIFLIKKINENNKNHESTCRSIYLDCNGYLGSDEIIISNNLTLKKFHIPGNIKDCLKVVETHFQSKSMGAEYLIKTAEKEHEISCSSNYYIIDKINEGEYKIIANYSDEFEGDAGYEYMRISYIEREIKKEFNIFQLEIGSSPWNDDISSDTYVYEVKINKYNWNADKDKFIKTKVLEKKWQEASD